MRGSGIRKPEPAATRWELYGPLVTISRSLCHEHVCTYPPGSPLVRTVAGGSCAHLARTPAPEDARQGWPGGSERRQARQFPPP
jgi:hypothetical protein